MELTGVPMFRKVLPITAVVEGWALHTGRLAWKMGFQNDPLDKLGRLQAKMLRAESRSPDSPLREITRSRY